MKYEYKQEVVNCPRGMRRDFQSPYSGEYNFEETNKALEHYTKENWELVCAVGLSEGGYGITTKLLLIFRRKKQSIRIPKQR